MPLAAVLDACTDDTLLAVAVVRIAPAEPASATAEELTDQSNINESHMICFLLVNCKANEHN
jgi:hypothetical protein